LKNQIIQTLEIENNCKGAFIGGELTIEPNEEIYNNVSIAWKHSPSLPEEKYKYLYVVHGQEDLSSFCKDSSLYSEYEKKIQAHRKAALTAKISLDDECFFDVIPMTHLKKWFYLREQAMQNILLSKNLDTSDYDILHKAHVLTSNISKQKINFENQQKRVLYSIFGSATGRLTTKKGSVPVLTLKKQERSKIKPQNSAFVELDLNAAEVRMLMALSGKAQPREDIHSHLQGLIIGAPNDRATFKERLFAWLYNPNSSDKIFDIFFNRETYKKFYSVASQKLTTPFGRVLTVDPRRAQNYLLQSTTSDQVIENAYNIQKFLKNKKSKIAFTLHDSIIIDMCKDEFSILREIKDLFEYTRWGKFLSTSKIGLNFGSLKEFRI
tara:strand:- start:217 stop:1359 length:1143 start_codon:yes stop_codon:yes gene_type:complete